MAIKRSAILAAVKTRLELILSASGYHSDLGSNVHVWKPSPFREDELPAINIIRRKNSLDGEWSGNQASKSQWVMAVEVQIICLPGVVSYATMEEFIADIYAAIGTDGTWGGLALKTDAVDDEIFITQHKGEQSTTETVVGGATVNIEITHRTDKWGEDLT